VTPRSAPPSVAEIRAAQEANFQRLLDLCFAVHPYYRRLWAERGIDRRALRSLADLPALPLTPKDAYMGDPEAFRLRIAHVGVFRGSPGWPTSPASGRTTWW